MYKQLHEKGWTDDELMHLMRNYTPIKEPRVLVVAAIVLLIFAVVAVPFAYAILGRLLSEPLFLVTLGLIGLPLGAVFALLLIDLDRFEHRHHIVLLILTPLVAVGAAYILFAQANALPEGLFVHNALIGGIVYAVAFIIPYVFMVQRQWNSKIGRLNT